MLLKNGSRRRSGLIVFIISQVERMIIRPVMAFIIFCFAFIVSEILKVVNMPPNAPYMKIITEVAMEIPMIRLNRNCIESPVCLALI
jgi:hypothetical protein